MAGPVMTWDSSLWNNGQARFISLDNQVDPYDNRMYVAGGSGGRNFYIDGKGHGYLSGNQARLKIRSCTYATELYLSFVWNSSLTSLSLRFRDRHNMPDPTTNRFGGYAIVIQSTQLEFFRENYHDNNTDLSPATAALGYTLTTGNIYHVRARCYDNAAHTNVILRCQIDNGSGYVTKGTATDSTPSAYMIDSDLYNDNSNTYIRVNGTSVKDVELRDVRVYNLKDNYTET